MWVAKTESELFLKLILILYRQKFPIDKMCGMSVYGETLLWEQQLFINQSSALESTHFHFQHYQNFILRHNFLLQVSYLQPVFGVSWFLRVMVWTWNSHFRWQGVLSALALKKWYSHCLTPQDLVQTRTVEFACIAAGIIFTCLVVIWIDMLKFQIEKIKLSSFILIMAMKNIRKCEV